MDKRKIPIVSNVAGLLMLTPQRWRKPLAYLFLAVFFVGGVAWAANHLIAFFSNRGCDAILFGTQVNVTGRPNSVTIKAIGPDIESLFVTPSDRRKMAVIAEVVIPGGKAITVNNPRGQYDITLKAKDPLKVALKAVVDCDD